MAFDSTFRASGSTPIYGMQERSQREGLRAESEALRRLEEKKKRDRIASEKPDALRGLVANAARAYAAYQTAGASEATGWGKKGSQVIQGKRSDGSNYDDPMGDMIEVGAGAYNMMEGMKQKDISDLKAEDIAAYNRDIAYAKSFAEGSPERKEALITARTTLETTQAGQDYGDRADTNPFLYTRGRRDVTIPTTILEGDQAGGDKYVPPKIDPDIKTPAETDGALELQKRQESRQLDNQKALEEARTSVRESASHKGLPELRESRQKAEEDRAWDRVSKEMDMRQGPRGGVRGEGDFSAEDAMWDKLSKEDDLEQYMKEKSAEKRLGYDPSLEKTTTEFKGSPMSKTYLEKAAKKDESTSEMDRMSDEKHRVSEVKKAKDTNKNKVIEFLADKGILPSSARDPLLVEDELIRRRELKRQQERRGTPDMPKPLIKSALRKRMDKLRKEQGLIQEALVKSGGTLSGGGSPGFDSAYPTSDAALLSRVK